MKPKVHHIGQTAIDWQAVEDYLSSKGCDDFSNEICYSLSSDIELLCTIFAKLCYNSFRPGDNPNVTKTRSIEDNFIHILESGHHSIFEHVAFNFIVTDCSRVFTHEMVRHRIGVAYSQTSGRYCNLSEGFDIVSDGSLEQELGHEEVYSVKQFLEEKYKEWASRLGLTERPFNEKKKLTSALRRWLVPTGVANELGMSLNLRELRHVIQMRTSRHAEWEIRCVFNQVYNLLAKKHHLIFHDANITEVDGYNEITFG